MGPTSAGETMQKRIRRIASMGLSDECLTRLVYSDGATLLAKIAVEADYKRRRPHSKLAVSNPVEFVPSQRAKTFSFYIEVWGNGPSNAGAHDIIKTSCLAALSAKQCSDYGVVPHHRVVTRSLLVSAGNIQCSPPCLVASLGRRNLLHCANSAIVSSRDPRLRN